MAVFVAASLAACGTPVSTASPAPTGPGQTPGSVVQSGSSPTPVATEQSADPALEAMLPKSIRGTTIHYASVRGDEFISEDDAVILDFLAVLGKSPTDLTSVQSLDASALRLVITAIHVASAEPDALLAAYLQAARAQSEGRDQISVATVAGREVTSVVDPQSDSTVPTYVYVKDDVIFIVRSPEQATAEEALRIMP